jgi:predicted aspartyl protease
MKKFSLLLFAALSYYGVYGQHSAGLHRLLHASEFFMFRDSLTMLAPHISSDDKSYFSCWEASLFRSSNFANSLIDSTLTHSMLHDSLRLDLLMLRAQNSFRATQYGAADSVTNIILSEYKAYLAVGELTEMKNFSTITKATKNTPEQRVQRNTTVTIKFHRDIAQEIKVPVKVNDRKTDFIFDTGANISAISASEAKRMQLKMLGATMRVATSSRAGVNAELALCDKLELGDATFFNVLFIVLPDADLKFVGGLYKIRGIIGMPVIQQLEEIQIHSNGNIISPEQPTTSTVRNLGFMGNMPFIAATFFGSTHAYVFDTGAGVSVFNSRFIAAYNDSLGKTKTSEGKIGGAGGTQKTKLIRFKNARYEIGGNTGVIKTGIAQVNPGEDALSALYGILGEDILVPWKVVTMNFKAGFVLLQN